MCLAAFAPSELPIQIPPEPFEFTDSVALNISSVLPMHIVPSDSILIRSATVPELAVSKVIAREFFLNHLGCYITK